MERMVAGIPCLSICRKSTSRWRRLLPPPRRRIVMCPKESLPEILCLPLVRLFSGFVFVRTEKSMTDIVRRPGLVGLNVLRALARGGEGKDRVRYCLFLV